MNVKTAQSRSASPLRTPSNLEANAVRDISGALNALLADTFALYLKTKNFHWHVSGPHFRDYHLMLDEQGEQVFATTDAIAERVRKLGGTTLRSIGHIARLQRVLDNDAEYVTPLDMLAELRDDNGQLALRMRETHGLCEEHGDVASASLLEVWIDEAERRVWFLSKPAAAAMRANDLPGVIERARVENRVAFGKTPAAPGRSIVANRMSAGDARMTPQRKTLFLFSVLSLSLSAVPAFADSSFDGTWVVDAPAAGNITSTDYSQCPALRFPIAIKDGQITGTLHRVPTATGDVIVEAGSASDSAPVTGTVQSDGSVTADWMNYHANGKLADKDGTVTIQGECGPRQATVTRIP